MIPPMLSRRQVLRGLGLGCTVLAAPRLASATLARAVSLPELVGRSTYALVGTAMDASSRWETVGQSRRIVTYVRIEVTQPIDGRPPPETSLTVRTLGGRVGDIGQLVHGEARFELGGPADDAVRLRASPNIPSLTRVDGSAVQRLVRRTVVEAERLVSDIMHAP
jgi:hypothetical protein